MCGNRPPAGELSFPHTRLPHTGQQVVVGVGDPNPLVGGAGMATLRGAGMAVAATGGEEEAACAALNPEFMARMRAQAGAP